MDGHPDWYHPPKRLKQPIQVGEPPPPKSWTLDARIPLLDKGQVSELLTIIGDYQLAKHTARDASIARYIAIARARDQWGWSVGMISRVLGQPVYRTREQIKLGRQFVAATNSEIDTADDLNHTEW